MYFLVVRPFRRSSVRFSLFPSNAFLIRNDLNKIATYSRYAFFPSAYVPRTIHSDSRKTLATRSEMLFDSINIFHFSHPFVPFAVRIYADRFLIDQPVLSTPYRNLK